MHGRIPRHRGVRKVGTRADLGYGPREVRTKSRRRSEVIGAKEKRHRTIEVADPDFGGTCVEVKRALFVDFCWCVRQGENFNADLGCASEQEWVCLDLRARMLEPGTNRRRRLQSERIRLFSSLPGVPHPARPIP
jgi:hypothetical protein